MVQELRRLPMWRGRLAAEMDRQRREPFAWGKHDCALGLAVRAALALTGEDLTPAWATYRSVKGAVKALKGQGFETVADAVGSILPEIHPAFARDGDIGLIPDGSPVGDALGIFDRDTLIVMTERGHGRRSADDVTRAFKIG